MHLHLKFVTDIVRPWKKLNLELVQQNSLDTNISDFITVAGDLAIKLSHFPEMVGRKSIRTNKNSRAFNIIVDIADGCKHDDLKDEGRNKLSVSSIFEGNDQGMFRFIRNSIEANHNKYGKADFLEVFKEASQFVLSQLHLNLFWNPPILEAPQIFSEKVFLNILFTRQIIWTGLSLKFLKRDDSANLIPYDPPSWLFELRSPITIKTETYFDYILELIKNSVDNESNIVTKTSISISSSPDPTIIDIKVNSIDNLKQIITIIQIISGEECTLKDIHSWQSIIKNLNADRIFLISRTQFSKEIKEYVSQSLQNVYLIVIDGLDALNIPLGFFEKLYKHNNTRITKIHKFSLGILQEDEVHFSSIKNKPIKELGNNFSLDKENLISFYTLCVTYIKPKKGVTEGKIQRSYAPRGKTNIYYKINETFIKIGVEVDFEWEMKSEDLRMPILTFLKSQMGISIWNLETFFSNGNSILELKVSVTKYGSSSAIGIL